MDAATGVMISSVASTMGVVIVAYLTFRTAKLSKAVEEVRHNTNSLTAALVATTATASHAEGKLEGQHEAAAVGAVPPVIKPP